jgi:SAM-dependent methyltransferase
MRGWRHAPFSVLSRAARMLDLAARGALYLAAGTLDRQALRDAITRSWDEFSRTESAILSGLMGWERAWYERVLTPRDDILVVGCGTGRDLIALMKLGYRVEGLDSSARAIDLAHRMLEREGLSATLYTAAIETVAPPRAFDVIIFSWFCYGYIPEMHARVDALRNVKSRLKPGGRLLISYLPAAEARRSFAIRLTRLMARLTRSDWRPAPGDTVGPPTANPRAIHYEHHFSCGELEKEAAGAGLRVASHERNDVGTAMLVPADSADGAAGDDPGRTVGTGIVTDS